MKYKSIVEPRGNVSFPDFTGERVYMEKFFPSDGLPSALKRWQPSVDAMLEGIDAPGPVYLMIDQGTIQAETSHRRPGVHIDGYWCDGGWETSPPTWSATMHSPFPPGHGPAPLPGRHVTEPTHGPRSSSWGSASFTAPEAIILASDVTASAAYVGEYEGEIHDGGDCSGIPLTGLEKVLLKAGRVWAGNVTLLHESLPVAVPVNRTLIRLNVPGWTPLAA